MPKPGFIIAADEDDFIVILDLDNNQQTLLPFRGNNPKYFESGHLVYNRLGQLFVIQFDLETLRTKGSPKLIASNIETLTTGTGQLAFSENGTLAYVPGTYDKNSRLTKIYRNGKKETLPFPANNFGTFQISPDGQHLAIEVTAFNADEIWVYNLLGGSTTKLTLTGNNYGMAWTPDGATIAFLSQRNNGWGLYKRSYQGVAPAEKIVEMIFRPYHYSPNAQWLVGSGLQAIHFGDSISVKRLSNNKFSETMPAFSPDGKWFAYHSDETGKYEVYMQPFPPNRQRWQVSKGGGGGPFWSQKSNKIFYHNGSQVNVVQYTLDEQPKFSEPQIVFEGNYVEVGGHSYGVMPDAQSFLVLEAVDTTSLFTEIRVVENWMVGIKE